MSTEFGLRLKEARELRGYKSQQSFADAFGVAQSTVGNWEAAAREPNFETMMRLANFLNVSVDYLLGLTAEKEGPLAEISEETLDAEIMAHLKSLSPEDLEKVDFFVQGILAARGGKPFPPAEGQK